MEVKHRIMSNVWFITGESALSLALDVTDRSEEAAARLIDCDPSAAHSSRFTTRNTGMLEEIFANSETSALRSTQMWGRAPGTCFK
jgi:hypothetical protein